MRIIPAVCALVLGSGSLLLAQDGGKIAWKGKGATDFSSELSEAKREGLPVLLLFTSEGSPAAKELSAGAFSDAGVVEASKRFVCLFVDCAWGKKNVEMSSRFRVTTYPTVVCCDSEGNVVGTLDVADAPSVARVLNRVADRFGPKGKAPDARVVMDNLRKAQGVARAAGKGMMMIFRDDSPPSVSVTQSLGDPSLKEMLSRFLIAQTEYRKDSELCAKLDVTRAPTILVLNPALAKPEEKPVAKITGSRNPRELLRDLEAAWTDLKNATPPAAKESGGTPSAKAPAEEPLSNDQVERQFILARMAVAQDLAKAGKKDKAIEILEDLLQSYPKHVLTKDVRRQLDDLRK